MDVLDRYMFILKPFWVLGSKVWDALNQDMVLRRYEQFRTFDS